MRNMSFFMTTNQIRNKSKTVTRRFGWWNLKAGTILNACVKCQGLKKGEKIEKICKIRILNVRKENLQNITKEECVKEGFPEMNPLNFVYMIMKHYKLSSCEYCRVNRIEFEYV